MRKVPCGLTQIDTDCSLVHFVGHIAWLRGVPVRVLRLQKEGECVGVKRQRAEGKGARQVCKKKLIFLQYAFWLSHKPRPSL